MGGGRMWHKWDANRIARYNPIFDKSNPRFEKSKTEIGRIPYTGNAASPSRTTISVPEDGLAALVHMLILWTWGLFLNNCATTYTSFLLLIFVERWACSFTRQLQHTGPPRWVLMRRPYNITFMHLCIFYPTIFPCGSPTNIRLKLGVGCFLTLQKKTIAADKFRELQLVRIASFY